MVERAVLEAATAAWASLSALAVLLLGILVFSGGRSRPPGAVPFGAFSMSWALHVVAGQTMSYAPERFAPQVHLLYLAFALPLPYFLVQFARSFAREGLQHGAWRAATAASVALPLSVVGALLLAPRLVYQGPFVFGERLYPQWGPLFAPFVMVPLFVAMGVALYALDAARRAAPTARPATRDALLAGGLATFGAFNAGNNLSYYALDLAQGAVLQSSLAYALLFAALAALSLVIGLRAAGEALDAPSPKMRLPPAIVSATTLIPLLFGLVEGIFAYFLLPRFNTIGLWRLAGVALIAYALARSRMPDLAPRSRQTLATALGVGAAATLGGLAIGAFMLLAPGAPLLLLAATAIPLAALSPSVQLARRALRVSAQPDLSDAALGRRVETYRAAIESALARDSLQDDQGFLAGLREELGISQDVHDALLVIARDNVLPAPHATHPGYERLRLLGEGAHGRAWLARRRADDELVVLKESPEHDLNAREALLRQMRIAQRVRHPRLVRIQEVVEGPRGPFLVMDHMAGGSLADALARGPSKPADAARLTIDVLDGLAALHDAGITHGDVKAGNILLDDEGRAHVADFGLARATDPQATLTFVGAQGTLAAMAPEQVRGAPASPSSDLYATGALLFRLVAGEHYLPFAGLDEARARALVLEAPPRLPHPRVPAALEEVLRRALAKEPAQRYASASAMRDALDAALARL